MKKGNNNQTHTKSTTTIILDVVRNLSILLVTVYIVFLLWSWNWIVAIISAIPIYIVVMNIIGFITLPLYALTPENKLIKNGFDEFKKGNFDSLSKINKEFETKYKTDKPDYDSKD